MTLGHDVYIFYEYNIYILQLHFTNMTLRIYEYDKYILTVIFDVNTTSYKNLLFFFSFQKKKMSHEIADRIVSGIDNGFVSEKYFEDQNLFINIYYCYYFHKHVSPYCVWRDRFIKTLTRNMRKKWSKNLPNFQFFVKEME